MARNQRELLSKLQQNGSLEDATVVHISPLENRANEAAIAHRHHEEMPSFVEKQVTLSDGSQVVVEHDNEIMFVGPRGVRMVVNCLPLFNTPSRDDLMAAATGKDHTEVHEEVEETLREQKTPNEDSPSKTDWVRFSAVLESQNMSEDASQEAIDESLSNPLPPNLSSSLIIPSDGLASFDDNFAPKPEDIFSTVDPFSLPTSATIDNDEDFIQSTRDRAIQEAYTIATGDSDDMSIAEEIAVKFVDDIRPLKARCGSVSFVSQKAVNEVDDQEVEDLSQDPRMTPLPPHPPTRFPRYTERGGWAMKLSHRKGVFGDRWQRRYFVLNGSTLSYFKKYGDAHPKGVIKLVPGSWCQPIPQGTARRADAMAQPNPGVISVMRCFAVNRPANHAASLSGLLASEGIAEAFRSQSVAVTNSENCSRTFYMIAPSLQERNGWVETIQHNLEAYRRSPEALKVACQELKNMLQAVGSELPISVMPPILLLLHQKKEDIVHRTMSYCQSHHVH